MSANTTDPANNVRFAEGIRDREMTFMPDQVQVMPVRTKPLKDVAPRAVGVTSEQFPTDALTAYDPRDKVMGAKLELQAGSNTGYTKFGKLIAKDEDFEWYQKKQAAAEVAEFQHYFAVEFDKMDPAQKKRAKALYPEFYAQRRATLKKNAKNMARLALIKLEGPETLDDIKMLYLAESGRLNLGPLQNLLNPETDGMSKDVAEARFTRGLMNPFSVWGKQAAPNTSAARKQRAGFYSKTAPNEDDTIFAKDIGDEAWFKVISDNLASFRATGGGAVRAADEELVPLAQVAGRREGEL